MRPTWLVASVLAVLLVSAAFAQWTETRKAFVGSPQERTIQVPFYMPYCAEPDFGWGMYYDHGRIPAVYRNAAYQRKCMVQMAAAGLNTLTIYGWWGEKNVDDVNLQMALAQETGLARRPVMILPCGDPRKLVPLLKVPAGFPEVVGYGPDEPANTPEAGKQVADSAAQWHEAGLRVVTAISADSAKGIGGPLDIWTIHVPKLGEVKPDGKHELWAYDCQQRGTNFVLHRYEAGLYSFSAHRRIGLKAMFWWAYFNDANSGVFLNDDGSIKWNALRVNDHALAGPDGPITTVGMKGINEGIDDFKILHEVERRGGNEAWLDKLCASVPLNFWDGTDMPKGPETSKYWWDACDVAKPQFDLDAIRSEACRLLHMPSPD